MTSKEIFCYSIPALRGFQAESPFYVTVFPLKYINSLFTKAETEISPELKAQRTLNINRIPEMADYILNNRDNYVFSSLTASISEEVTFESIDDQNNDIGTLKVPFDAKVLINDGQHRRAAIERAIEDDESLMEESISIVFYIDKNLDRSQQMFADLNRHAVKPAKSLGILYDHRDPLAQLCSSLIQKVDAFVGMTEKEKATLSNRENKMFTLSSIYKATGCLLGYKKGDEIKNSDQKLAITFWNEITKNIPDWKAAKNREIAPYILRRDFIHTHGITLQALGNVGHELIHTKKEWKTILSGIRHIDWSRDNLKNWQGRVIVHGKINKGSKHVTLLTNFIKKELNIPLSEHEAEIEKTFNGCN